jgi:hypothetical protein
MGQKGTGEVFEVLEEIKCDSRKIRERDLERWDSV